MLYIRKYRIAEILCNDYYNVIVKLVNEFLS